MLLSDGKETVVLIDAQNRTIFRNERNKLLVQTARGTGMNLRDLMRVKEAKLK